MRRTNKEAAMGSTLVRRCLKRGPVIERTEFAVENHAIELYTHSRLQHYVKRLVQEPVEIVL